MITRRSWLSIVGLGALPVLAYPIAFEPFWFEVSQTRVDCGAQWAEPMRLLHLADMHASSDVPLQTIEHAFQLGLEQKPDLVCLTGDFVTNQSGFDSEHYVRVLRKLAESVPTFAVLGNHDGGAWAFRRHGDPLQRLVERMIASSGITLLHNASKLVRLNDRQLQLVGVGDLWANEIDGQSAFSSISSDVPTILLSHNPDSKEVLSSYPWQLMLSGHTHGGQVLVPFCGPCFAPVEDKRYVAGLGKWQGRQVYVTRGVGNVGGVRFRCRPEISLLLVA